MWAEKGKRLTCQVKKGYKSFYLFSAVSPHTGESFTLFLPEVNTEMMNIYLKEFNAKYADKKIVIIMDQATWHRSHSLKNYSNIEIKFLPPYSPELNPVEKLWWWLKKEVMHNRIYISINELMDAIEETYLKITPNVLSTLCACNYL
jgi:transposase